jgi:long-subunit acyl-CoA synthetase (AMP-forming)
MVTSSRSRPSAKTLPALLRVQAQLRGTDAAMLQKQLGIWRIWTWRAVAEQAVRLAASLDARGIRAGERVLLVGGPRPRLAIALLAIQAIGAVPVLPPDEDNAVADELPGIRLAFAAGQRTAERILALAGTGAPALSVVVVDGHGLRATGHVGLEPYDALLDAQPDATPISVDALDPRNPAFVVAQLGAEDRAKLVPVSHTDALAWAKAAGSALGTTYRDRLLALMTLSCAPALLLTQVQSLVAGCPVFYPESDATALQDLPEAGPTLLTGPPLLWRQLRRAVFLRAVGSGAVWRRRLERDFALFGEPSGPARSGPLRRLVRHVVRDHLGLSRVRLAVGFGDTMPRGLAAFCDALGIPRLADDVLGRAIGAKFVGATDAATDLAEAEAELRGSLFVRHACAVRTDAGRVAALVGIDADAVAAWAQTAGVIVAGADGQHRVPEVEALIAAEIARGNARLPPEQQVAAFLFTSGAFSRAAGELTAEGALRRTTVMQLRGDTFASLRAGRGHDVYRRDRSGASTVPPSREPARADRHADAMV